MRALTLTQPWAGLVASGMKLVENRPRAMIKREDFGKPFAIHASREISAEAMRRIVEVAPELCTDPSLPWCPLASITSAVIGVATISRALVAEDTGRENTRVLDISEQDVVELGEQRRWFFGPIAYVLRDIRALETPVPCRGFQGFWTLPTDVERQVMEQLRG